MILRDSEFKGAADVDQVLRLARRGQGSDQHGYRADFIKLVREYQALTADEVVAGRD